MQAELKMCTAEAASCAEKGNNTKHTFCLVKRSANKKVSEK